MIFHDEVCVDHNIDRELQECICDKKEKMTVEKTKAFAWHIRNCALCENGIEPSHETIFVETWDAAIKEVIKREEAQECLLCGESLRKQIMNNEIHIHLCTSCRAIRVHEITKERLGEKG